MPSNTKPQQKYSYPAKNVTLVAVKGFSGRRLSRKWRKETIGRAAELVGIVPFDWERKGTEFAMYFGVDTVELALAAQHRLQQSNFKVHFWTEEEGMVIAAKLLEQLECEEGVEIGPITRVIVGPDNHPEVEIIEWRDIGKKHRYQN